MSDSAAQQKQETIPENAQDLTAFVQNMLEQMVLFLMSIIWFNHMFRIFNSVATKV